MSLDAITPLFAAGATHTSVALPLLHGWLLPILFPIIAVVGTIYYVNSRPLRRQEAARFLLDLIESAVEQGQSVERHIVSLARCKDASVGVRFHLLAAYIERGRGLVAALEKVPDLLPAQVTAMLKVGETLGDYSRVLPACRLLLRDGTSQTRALINYQVAFGFVANPVLLFLLPLMAATIFPVFRDIAASMKIAPGRPFQDLMVWMPFLCVVQLVLVLACFVFTIFMLGGPRFASLLQAGVPAARVWFDWFELRVPWRRKRLQRDFSAMLAFLLDAGEPEERALRLAAFATDNSVFIGRAEEAAGQLHNGVKLTEAVLTLDDSGEFRWRLANAAHSGRGFLCALQGWQASLEARAFQLEQGAAHAISTSLLLINTVTVALIAAGVFQFVSNLVGASFYGPGLR